MAISRKKIDRDASLTFKNKKGADEAPGWEFVILYKGQRFSFDFTPYCRNGREDLAEHLREAVWTLRHELSGNSLRKTERALCKFWRFLDDLYGRGEKITNLRQVDRTLIDRFLLWQDLQLAKRGQNKGLQLSKESRRVTFESLKTFLINRRRRVPEAVSPQLDFPRNNFPKANLQSFPRQPYSPTEQERIDAALNVDLRHIYEGGGDALPTEQVLVVHLLVLARTTGRNLQSLLDLQRDSLLDHPLADRCLLVTYKNRGYTSHASTFRKAAVTEERELKHVPAYIGDYIRWLCKFTAPLAEEANGADSSLVFIRRVQLGHRKGMVCQLDPYAASRAVSRFVKRHSLLSDRGEPLPLNVSRLRPTFGHELYRRTRDIRTVQQALGHANAQTTARYYVGSPLEAERDHAFVVDAMVGQFTRMEIDGKILLAADGQIPIQDVLDLLNAGYSTGIARCRNPFRDSGNVCAKFFRCFSCPNMIVFEDDLWRLFSFYYRLLDEQPKISPVQWLKTYGPIIKRIDTDIVPQFPADRVDEAKRRAVSDPHPTWKGLFL